MLQSASCFLITSFHRISQPACARLTKPTSLAEQTNQNSIYQICCERTLQRSQLKHIFLRRVIETLFPHQLNGKPPSCCSCCCCWYCIFFFLPRMDTNGFYFGFGLIQPSSRDAFASIYLDTLKHRLFIVVVCCCCFFYTCAYVRAGPCCLYLRESMSAHGGFDKRSWEV